MYFVGFRLLYIYFVINSIGAWESYLSVTTESFPFVYPTRDTNEVEHWNSKVRYYVLPLSVRLGSSGGLNFVTSTLWTLWFHRSQKSCLVGSPLSVCFSSVDISRGDRRSSHDQWCGHSCDGLRFVSWWVLLTSLLVGKLLIVGSTFSKICKSISKRGYFKNTVSIITYTLCNTYTIYILCL